MAKQDQERAMQMAGLSEKLDVVIQAIREMDGFVREANENMARLLEALADEEQEDAAASVITTMDGERLEIPSGDDFL